MDYGRPAPVFVDARWHNRWVPDTDQLEPVVHIDEIDTRNRIAVVGGGILGGSVALLLARNGFEVDLFEAESRLMSGASSANEGKVHLGQVYALGDAETLDLMLRGAGAFAPLVERALGRKLDWTELCSDDFRYVVMQGSLVSAGQLAERYRSCNERLKFLFGRGGMDHYLGRPLDRVTETEPTDFDGQLAFRSFERSVDPLRLAALYEEAIHSNSAIRVHLSTAVAGLYPEGPGVAVDVSNKTRRSDPHTYLAAVNCSWHQQHRLHPPDSNSTRRLNYRVKAAVRLRGGDRARSVTLVQGPYGDVVGHRDYTFASWYPEARIWHELSEVPSEGALEALTRSQLDEQVMQRQLSALSDLGILPGWSHAAPIGGMVLGDGGEDIDKRHSQLHSRARFGVRTSGRVFTPLNFKWSTAPLAAFQAVREMEMIRCG